LEAVVFANRIADRLRNDATASLAPLEPVQTPPALPETARSELRALMQAHAGVVRNAEGLGRALGRVDALCDAHGATHAFIAARFILHAALARTESRGGHYRSDFPNASAPVRTFLTAAELAAAS
jgi:L-aspartate oxidase